MKRDCYYSELTIETFEDVYDDILNEREIKKDSEDYWDLFSSACQNNWDDFISNLKYSQNNKPCVLTGRLGLWNGNPQIEPIIFDNIVDAIKRTITNSIDNIEVYKVNGHLEINAFHHDGCNCFEIHLLNERGCKAGDNANLSNRCYHKAMSKYLF